MYWTLTELMYDKYCRPDVNITREDFYYISTGFKQEPSYGCMQSMCSSNVLRQPSPSRLCLTVQNALKYLFAVMLEISADHPDHPNNTCANFRTRMAVGILSQFLYFLVQVCINRSINLGCKA